MNKRLESKVRADISPFARPFLWLGLILIELYQKALSPILGPRCRFYPSCSNYAKESLVEHGPLKGGYLAACRCLKCHPFHPGGIDLVPPKRDDPIDSAFNPNYSDPVKPIEEI